VEHPAHRDVTRREFARQAGHFQSADSVFRDASILGWIAEHVPVPVGAQILDVAGGTGEVGRYLGSPGASAVILDLTEEMLQAGLRAARTAGEHHVTFVRGDAADLPFPDRQFDVVVTRFALHHMLDPAAVVAEMARVCTTGGSVTIVDMVNGGPFHDELERMRDPSHTRALAESEFGQLLTGAGHPPVKVADREHTMAAERWLARSETSEDNRILIRQALAAEAEGGPPTGSRAARDSDGALMITQRWILASG
jgi:SAM-dependent methyltransferase